VTRGTSPGDGATRPNVGRLITFGVSYAEGVDGYSGWIRNHGSSPAATHVL
jgi:hypothetical protein